MENNSNRRVAVYSRHEVSGFVREELLGIFDTNDEAAHWVDTNRQGDQVMYVLRELPSRADLSPSPAS
jgi:hypothetical protein